MFREIRYGWRHLSRARGFACVAIVTLALAGGGTGALVSLLQAIVLRPLNVPKPERLKPQEHACVEQWAGMNEQNTHRLRL